MFLIAKLQQERLPNATINRSLTLLRRMFRLAFEDGRLWAIPHFPMLKENNVRKGFVVHDQYILLRDALPDYLKPVLVIGYFTGMREGEILPFRLDQLNIRERQKMTSPARKAWRNTCVSLRLGRFVCVHCGDPTVGTKKCARCSKLEKQNRRRHEGLLFHDLRRTGVRNLVRVGVPERVAMDVSGHKTGQCSIATTS
jgi:integrase